jgi:hypothetical protein
MMLTQQLLLDQLVMTVLDGKMSFCLLSRLLLLFSFRLLMFLPLGLALLWRLIFLLYLLLALLLLASAILSLLLLRRLGLFWAPALQLSITTISWRQCGPVRRIIRSLIGRRGRPRPVWLRRGRHRLLSGVVRRLSSVGLW